MAAGASDLREQLATLQLDERAQRRPWRREELYERVRGVDARLPELGVGSGIDPRGEGSVPDRLLVWLRRAGDPHLVDEGAARELAQRRDLCLPAETTQAAIWQTVGAPRNAVTVAVVGVGQRHELRVGDGVQQPEPEQAGRGPPPHRGGLWRHRLLVDPEHRVQRGGHAVLDDRPPDASQVVTHATMVRRRVRLHFVADAAHDGSLVALGAGAGVEERPQPRRRCERGLKYRAALPEPVLLTGGQQRQRTAQGVPAAVSRRIGPGGGQRLAGRDCGEQQNRNAAAGGHGSPFRWQPCATMSQSRFGGKRTLGRRA